MLTFYPEFEASKCEAVEILFVLDLSCSMKDEALEDLKKAVALSLTHLPNTCFFNILVFGFTSEEMFPQSKQVNKENVQKALDYVSTLVANMGTFSFSSLFFEFHFSANFLFCFFPVFF